jgi:hypothetical protein
VRKLPSGKCQARFQVNGEWRTAPATFRTKGLADSHASARAALIYQHTTRDRDAAIAEGLSSLVEASRRADA